MPAGCIFGDKGPAAFVKEDNPIDLLALLGITNSSAFVALVALQMAFGSYEVGVIQRTPVPNLTPASTITLSTLARRAWALKRSLDTITENSHAFYLPALLQTTDSSLTSCTQSWATRVQDTNDELASIQAEIDDLCFDLYGISQEDRLAITQSNTPSESDSEDTEDEDSSSIQADPAALTTSLLSYTVGLSFGRFDIRHSTGQLSPPAEPDPFAALPRCSPGMLSTDDDLPATVPPPGYALPFPTNGILVDDPGHPDDLLTRCRSTFDIIFGSDAESFWSEAAPIIDPKKQDLLSNFFRGSKGFFEQHIKTYSKSRRKAPIYWQLATASASYSVWLYCHRLTSDTFYLLSKDVVAPKLQHEERQLTVLRQEAGPTPTSSQLKVITAQEDFLAELRSFLEEVSRIAPLWRPNLDDGVIINCAPLWRLFPQHKAWQKECRICWSKLVKGEYDWAHWAMHLWPERVVPKCIEDRSLAIAHGLENEFWFEGEDGKFQPRKDLPPNRVDELIQERTSTSVKAALDDLLSAPAPAGTAKKRGGRKRS